MSDNKTAASKAGDQSNPEISDENTAGNQGGAQNNPELSDDNTTGNQGGAQNNPELSDDNTAGNQGGAQNNPNIQADGQEIEIMSQEQPPVSLSMDKFMMLQFRRADCPSWLNLLHPHEGSSCPQVHFGYTRRRDPFTYTPKICLEIPDCDDDDECEFAHNIFEYCLHPKKFTKTRCCHGVNCKMYPCMFPHFPRELIRDTAKPPLPPLPPLPPAPLLPLPPNLQLPPPAPIQPLSEVPPPPPPIQSWEMPPPRRRRLPPLPFPPRRNDDEASASGSK